MRLAIYARCSASDKGQDPELQLSPLREYAQRRGITITGEYVDNGISGSKDKRPALDRLMDDARKRRIGNTTARVAVNMLVPKGAEPTTIIKK